MFIVLYYFALETSNRPVEIWQLVSIRRSMRLIVMVVAILKS